MEIKEHGMVCICRAEGRRDAEQARLAAHQRMGLKNPSDLAPALLLSLAWDFGAEVDVAVDQWFGVRAITGQLVDDAECDHPLDGFVAIWQALADRHPDKVAYLVPAEDAATRALSEVQLADQQKLEEAFDRHLEGCADCDREHFKLCPPGRAAWNQSLAAAATLIDKWGSPPDTAASPSFYGWEPGD